MYSPCQWLLLPLCCYRISDRFQQRVVCLYAGWFQEFAGRTNCEVRQQSHACHVS